MPDYSTEPADRFWRARRVFERQFVEQADPGGLLPPAERAAAVRAAKRAHYERMARRRWAKWRARQAES